MRKAPGQIAFTMSKATRRALIAVFDQRVFRLYGSDGNVMKCDGKPTVAPRMLWRLLAFRWIEDEPGPGTGAFIRKVRMRLTAQGAAALGKQVTPVERGQVPG